MALQTYQDFLNENELVEPCLIEPGVLPFQGKLLLYGYPEGGKSMAVLQLAFCVATGKPWFGVYEVKQGLAVYVQCEIGRGQFRNRVRTMAQNFPEASPEQVRLLSSLTIKTHPTSHEWAELTDEVVRLRPTLLILDPQFKLLWGDENSAQDLQQLYDALDRLIAASGCSIVLVSHPRKSRHDEGGQVVDLGYQDVKGSMRQVEWPDAVLRMSRTQSGGALRFEKVRADEHPETLQLKYDPATLMHYADNKVAAADKVVLGMLENGGKPRADVLSELIRQGFSESTAKRALARLEADNILAVKPMDGTRKLLERRYK